MRCDTVVPHCVFRSLYLTSEERKLQQDISIIGYQIIQTSLM